MFISQIHTKEEGLETRERYRGEAMRTRAHVAQIRRGKKGIETTRGETRSDVAQICRGKKRNETPKGEPESSMFAETLVGKLIDNRWIQISAGLFQIFAAHKTLAKKQIFFSRNKLFITNHKVNHVIQQHYRTGY